MEILIDFLLTMVFGVGSSVNLKNSDVQLPAFVFKLSCVFGVCTGIVLFFAFANDFFGPTREERIFTDLAGKRLQSNPEAKGKPGLSGQPKPTFQSIPPRKLSDYFWPAALTTFIMAMIAFVLSYLSLAVTCLFSNKLFGFPKLGNK